MIKIFIAKHPTEAHFVRNLLVIAGIESEVKGEFLFGARGELAMNEDTLPSVWIQEKGQEKEAMQIITSYVQGLGSPDAIGKPWSCGNCGEILEPQFTTCWQCGIDRK